MSLLSKSEIQFLKGQKRVSKSYEYKFKSILKKKLSNLVDNDLPLLSSLFPNLLDLTKIGKDMSPLKATIPGSNPGRSTLSFDSCNNSLDNYSKFSKNDHYYEN